MHAVVKDTPAVVLTCMEKFFSISSHTPQVRCVSWKERSFACVGFCCSFWRARIYCACNCWQLTPKVPYMSVKKHLIIWGWMNE